MKPIVMLESDVADKIAAGEVIERPASVVKELIENAVDAGAKHIHVDVWDAGKGSIRVKDDGSGMRRKDAPLALQRHATSKITKAADLNAIRTLGFRGEALPSMLSVSKMTLITKNAGEDVGVKIEASSAGMDIIDWHAPEGTDVSVKQLFYNTPARLKFLKSDTAERRAIVGVVTNAALSRPDVAFSLVLEGRTNLQTPGTGHPKDTIAALLGSDAVGDMLPVERMSPWGHLTGYVGKPHLAKGNRNSCFVFVNGRRVENRGLYVAVEKGYEALLAFRRYPVAVLNVDLDPTLVDVNVHPAKTEVRFRDEREVFRLLLNGVRETIVGARLTIPLGESKIESKSESNASSTDETPTPNDHEAISSTTAGLSQTPLKWGNEAIVLPKRPAESVSEQPPAIQWFSGDDADSGEPSRVPLDTDAKDWAGRPRLGPPRSRQLPVEISPRDVLAEGKVFGQIAKAYILLQGPGSLWVIDQHIAEERILYEEFLESLSKPTGTSQQLLAPERVTLTPVQRAAFKELQPMLEQAGFTLDCFGGDDYLLRSVPLSAGPKGRQIVLEMLEELADPTGDALSLREKTAAAYACRAAVKAGQKLLEEEMVALVRRLATTHNPFACPHGRPVIIEIGHDELARRFERI